MFLNFLRLSVSWAATSGACSPRSTLDTRLPVPPHCGHAKTSPSSSSSTFPDPLHVGHCMTSGAPISVSSPAIEPPSGASLSIRTLGSWYVWPVAFDFIREVRLAAADAPLSIARNAYRANGDFPASVASDRSKNS